MGRNITIVMIFLMAGFQILSQTLTERGLAPSGHVFAMEQKGDVLYVGGSFNRVGYSTGGAALLENKDTVPNLQLPYVHGEVFAIEPDGQGGWYLGGDFDQVGVVPRTNIVHVTSTMEIDPDFDPQINNKINTLLYQNGILYMGGLFTEVDGNARTYLAAINTSSNNLESFNPQPNGQINKISTSGEVGVGDKILIAGYFTQVSGENVTGIAKINRFNGTVESFPDLPSGRANDLLVDGNDLYVGGAFSGGVMAVDLTNNTIKPWSPNIKGFGFSLRVNALAKIDTVIYIGGNFNSVDGVSRRNMAAVSTQGNLLDFAPEPNAEVFELYEHNGDLLAGGDFLNIGNHNIAHVAKFDDLGNIDQDFNLRPDWSTHVIAGMGTQLMLGGEFLLLQSHERDNAYAMKISNGSLLEWAPIGNFLTVNHIKADEINDVIYLAGWDSNSMKNIKAFDDTLGEEQLYFNFVFNNSVNCIDQDNQTGNLYVGGAFTTVNGENRSRMAAVDQSGTLLPFSITADDEVRHLKVSEENTGIYFSGKFTQVNDSSRFKVAFTNFDGELNAWAPEIDSQSFEDFIYVHSILPMGNQVFLAGTFETINGENRNRMGAVDPVTGNLLPWNANVDAMSIDFMEPFQNGLMITGESLNQVGATSVSHIAFIGAQSGQVLVNIADYGFGNLQKILTMEAADNTLYVGGTFSMLREKHHPHVATITFPDQPDFGDVERYTPSKGGNIGDVTLEIFGSGFKPGTEIMLRGDGMDDLVAVDGSTFNHDGVRLMATFDLRGQPAGPRDIAVMIPDGSTILLGGAFTITEGVGAKPWADIVAPSLFTKGAREFFYISYGNSGDVDALGVPMWITLSPNITVKDIGFDVIQYLEEDHLYYDSIPEYVMIDSLIDKPYNAKAYSFIVPKLPAGSSFVVAMEVEGTEIGDFYCRAWTQRPMYGSPLKYWVGDCNDAIFTKIVGYIPYAACATGVIDAFVSPYVDYAWDPDFASFSYNINYLSALVGTGLDCAGDVLSGGTYGFASRVVGDLLTVKGDFDLIQSCTEMEEKEDSLGQIVASCDPNDKSGPIGQGSESWLNTQKNFSYMVRFENEEEATAPAKLVLIRDTLDSVIFDLSTLKLHGFTIADNVYTINGVGSEYNSIVDLRPRLPYLVKIDVSLDYNIGELVWTFTTLDVTTGLPVTGPLEGFLPPNEDGVSGRGSVFYDVRVLDDLPSGTEIKNKAGIFFDYNDPIITNEWMLKADNDSPESHMQPLPETVYDDEILLKWTGSDVGSGIKNYRVMYREVGGEWYYVTSFISDTSIVFSGTPGKHYEFMTIAVDSALNVEHEPLVPDVSTYFHDETTNVLNGQTSGIRFYPNPADETLFVGLNEAFNKFFYRVYDISGRLVLKQNLFNTNENDVINIDLKGLRPGLYLLQWQNNMEKGEYKLIKR
ncbi:DUF7619 domain-containing protein [Saccharicrinis sp. 156]|uniref:T9SS type A sorting domain-containing protein n=1 Tax=Saccharicrinis sp. 156 TaxID=3417574 RepID=UPI003D325A2A